MGLWHRTMWERPWEATATDHIGNEALSWGDKETTQPQGSQGVWRRETWDLGQQIEVPSLASLQRCSGSLHLPSLSVVSVSPSVNRDKELRWPLKSPSALWFSASVRLDTQSHEWLPDKISSKARWGVWQVCLYISQWWGSKQQESQLEMTAKQSERWDLGISMKYFHNPWFFCVTSHGQ